MRMWRGVPAQFSFFGILIVRVFGIGLMGWFFPELIIKKTPVSFTTGVFYWLT